MKPLQRRLDRIERCVPVDTRCPTCRYPHERSRRIMATSHDRPLERCAECGRSLDDAGIPLHQPYRRVIVLEESKNPNRHALRSSKR